MLKFNALFLVLGIVFMNAWRSALGELKMAGGADIGDAQSYMEKMCDGLEQKECDGKVGVCKYCRSTNPQYETGCYVFYMAEALEQAINLAGSTAKGKFECKVDENVEAEPDDDDDDGDDYYGKDDYDEMVFGKEKETVDESSFKMKGKKKEL